MAGLVIHVIDKDGYLVCTRSGDADSVMLAIEIENSEYSIKGLPDTENPSPCWRWVDNKWIDTAE